MNAVTELQDKLQSGPPTGAQLLVSEAERVLRQSGYIALRRIQCACEDGVISLCGKVPSFFLKQMAQTLVARVVGVRRVDNQIKVQ